MQVTTKILSDTLVKLTIYADTADLEPHRQSITKKLAAQVKLAGFRAGKVPPELAEKHVDANYLQTQVLEAAINELYIKALNEASVKVVAQPKVEVVKFVPFTTLEFTAEVEVIGKVKLPDYKNLNVKKDLVNITDDDVKVILERLQKQSAEYSVVERPAKHGDRVTFDFEGKDAKGKAINNTSGKDYPLILGSNSFVEGFEKELIGLKTGDAKTFTITFPKDYYLKLLCGQNVTFNVTIKKVEDVLLAPIDDALAAKVGPFKTLSELKIDIRKQLNLERERQVQQAFEEKLIKAIVAKTKVTLPPSVVEEQMQIIDKEFKDNLARRNEKFEDYLTNTAKTETEYREQELKPLAEERLKAGLVLAEIANVESIKATEEELKIRIQVLKNRYKDAKMQAELDKPENRRDIASRLVTEKTIAKLVSFNTAK